MIKGLEVGRKVKIFEEEFEISEKFKHQRLHKQNIDEHYHLILKPKNERVIHSQLEMGKTMFFSYRVEATAELQDKIKNISEGEKLNFHSKEFEVVSIRQDGWYDASKGSFEQWIEYDLICLSDDVILPNTVLIYYPERNGRIEFLYQAKVEVEDIKFVN